MMRPEHDERKYLEEIYGRMERRAREMGLWVGRLPVKLFLLSPVQHLGAFAKQGLYARYFHWSFGKKAEQFVPLLKAGLSDSEIFLPANPPVAFLSRDADLAEKIGALARILAYQDFCYKNKEWGSSNYSGILNEAREHACFVNDLLNNPSINSKNVEQTLTVAHSIAPQSGHAISNPSADDLIGAILKRDTALASWQKDLFRMARKEWLWFPPFYETNVMMNGWAKSLELELLRFAKLPAPLFRQCLHNFHSSLSLPEMGEVNASLLGYKIFEQLKKSVSRVKLSRILAEENDISFVKKYLSQNVALECGLFSGGHGEENPQKLVVKELSADEGWKKVRDLLVKWLGLNSFPMFKVADEYGVCKDGIVFIHIFEGRFLDKKETQAVAEGLTSLIGKKVYVVAEGICNPDGSLIINVSNAAPSGF